MFLFVANVVVGRRRPIQCLFTSSINPSLLNSIILLPLSRSLHQKPKSIKEVGLKPITKNNNHSSSLTLSYLINSCGLSPQSAISAAKRINIKATLKPDSNLALFKSHGFSDTHITKLVTQCPQLLLCNWDKSIKPKFHYFLSIGYADADLPTLVSFNPELLRSSLQRRLKHNIDLLRPIFSTNQQLVEAVCRSSAWLLTIKLETNFLPNVRTLQSYGVPATSIARLAATYPRILMQATAGRFKTTIKLLGKMGFDLLSTMFVHGISAMLGMKSSTWERKVAFYKSMGWSEAEFFCAFRKKPEFMPLSEEKIKRMMDFSAEKMNWGPLFVAAYPVLLTFSLEKRVIPRCSVMRILESKGLMVRSKGVRFFNNKRH